MRGEDGVVQNRKEENDNQLNGNITRREYE